MTGFAVRSAGHVWMHIQPLFYLFIQIHQRKTKYSYSCSLNPLKYINVKTNSMIWIYEDTEGENEGEDEDVIVEVWIALCWCKWRRKAVWKVARAFAYASMQIKGLSGIMHLHRDISDAMGTQEPGNPALSPLVNRKPWPGPSVPLENKSRKFIWPITPSENRLRGEMMFFRVWLVPCKEKTMLCKKWWLPGACCCLLWLNWWLLSNWLNDMVCAEILIISVCFHFVR